MTWDELIAHNEQIVRATFYDPEVKQADTMRVAAERVQESTYSWVIAEWRRRNGETEEEVAA